ncbi:MAG: cobyric acid synthase [Clostridiales bacterium]|jgi:adenosylcobyric acid synthase|nr:cobyric acid synthase [Clostridiales bacterium]
MKKSIMVQGTCSGAGKSITVAGLCRVFKQDGYRAAPFKSQNMALNSYVTQDGLEMGRAQVTQAECAGLEPDVRMNPILLKPTGDSGSQVVVNGRPIGDMTATAYYEYKHQLKPEILKAYDSLAGDYDVIVVEGAGSPAEINLNQDDFVNMGLAAMIDAPVLLVGDIDRGGVFASLYGTVNLLPQADRARIKGLVINKFRGDQTILKPGLDMLEDLVHVPVLGVVPLISLDIDDEDSLSERLHAKHEKGLIDIAVIRLPRISNFTDFNILDGVPHVSLRYVDTATALNDPDLIILPGTKNTMSDLLWLRQNGLEAAIQAHASRGKPVFGICGGYQMLGRLIRDPDQMEGGGEIAGMGLLSGETCFGREKERKRVTGVFQSIPGDLSLLSGQAFEGYEIHMGGTEGTGEPLILCRGEGREYAAGERKGNVAGCYVHGVFDRAAESLVRSLCAAKGITMDVPDMKSRKEREYDKLADCIRNHIDMNAVYQILGR